MGLQGNKLRTSRLGLTDTRIYYVEEEDELDSSLLNINQLVVSKVILF